MWKPTIVLAVNIILFINTEAALLPSVCDISDSVCVTKVARDFVPTFAAGIPELGVESCEPMFIKRIDASSPGLKLILTDVNLTGLKDVALEDISFDKSKKFFTLKLLATVRVECQYEMLGQLVLIQIKGSGPAHGTLRKAEIIVKIDVEEEVGEDGKVHWHFKYNTHTFNIKDKSDIHFEKLFDGNEHLAATAKAVISQNGNEIVLSNGGPVIKAVVDGIIVRVNEFLKAIPLEELQKH